MTLQKIFVTLFLVMLMSYPAYSGEITPEGKYTRLFDHQFNFDGKRVEIIKFLSFYCGHCYQFEKQVPVINGNFPKKIQWKIIPIYWGNGSSKPGEAYFLAEEAGKGDEMKKALFEAFFEEKKDIGTVEVLEDLGIKTGLGFDFSRRLRAGEKKKDADHALALAKAYGIEETPTLVIAGNLKTVPSSHSDVKEYRDNIVTIIRSIFGK